MPATVLILPSPGLCEFSWFLVPDTFGYGYVRYPFAIANPSVYRLSSQTAVEILGNVSMPFCTLYLSHPLTSI